MRLRVLLGAVVAALALAGSGATVAQADLGQALYGVQSFGAVEISALEASGTDDAPAESGDYSPSKNADPDSDQDPVVKVRQSGILIVTGPIRRPTARQAAQCLPERPPAPPPRPEAAANNFAAQSASVGAETAGSELPPWTIVAARGAQTFLSSTSTARSVAKAQALSGDVCPQRDSICGPDALWEPRAPSHAHFFQTNFYRDR